MFGIEVETIGTVSGINREKGGQNDTGGKQAGDEDAPDGDAILRAVDEDEGDGQGGGAGSDAAAHCDTQKDAGPDRLFAQGAPPTCQEEGKRPWEILGRDAVDIKDRDEGEGESGKPPIGHAAVDANEGEEKGGARAKEGVEEIEPERAGLPEPRADILLDGIAGKTGGLVNAGLGDMPGGEGNAPVIGVLAIARAQERQAGKQHGQTEEGQRDGARGGVKAHPVASI